MAIWTDLLPPVVTRAFGRKAASAPATGGAGFFGGFAQFVGPQAADYPTARGFTPMARLGFGSNAYAYAAVTYVSEACAGIPWLLYDKRGTGDEDRTEVRGHPILTLLNTRANAREGAARMWTRLNALMLLSGDAFWIAIRPGKTTVPAEIYAVRPDRMTPDVNKATGELLQWVYSVNGSGKQYYDLDVVRHLTEFNPEDDGIGLAPARVAARAIDQHNAANDWNTALLQNMARPGGMLTPQNSGGQPVVVPQSSWEALRDDLLQKYSSPKNAGRPIVARMPMSWEDMSTTPKDMDWLSGKTQAAREIAIAMRVPPELLGDAANKTYSNMQEARKGFYTERVLPRMDMLKGELNSWLLPLYGLDPDRYELDYDTDDIEALQEDRQAIYDRAYKGWESGLLTLNQALKYIGESEVEGPLGDVRLVPMGKATLEEVVDGTAQPTPPPLLAPALVPDPKPADANAPADGNAPTEQSPAKSRHARRSRAMRSTVANKAYSLDTEEAKAIHWRKTETTREAWYGTVGKQVADQFKAEHKAVMAAIKGKTTAKAMQSAADKAVNAQQDNWTALLSAIHIGVGEAFAKQTANDLADEAKALRVRSYKALDTVALVDDWQERVVRQMLTTGAKKVKHITDTTRARIQNELAQGVANEDTIDQLATRLDGLYLDSLIPHRSETIARTETISASNASSIFTAQQTGLNLEKEWIATRDGRTREAHADADGQRVALDEPFVVDGEELQYPGDPDGSAGNIIECRCTQGYHVLE